MGLVGTNTNPNKKTNKNKYTDLRINVCVCLCMCMRMCVYFIAKKSTNKNKKMSYGFFVCFNFKTKKIIFPRIFLVINCTCIRKCVCVYTRGKFAYSYTPDTHTHAKQFDWCDLNVYGIFVLLIL